MARITWLDRRAPALAALLGGAALVLALGLASGVSAPPAAGAADGAAAAIVQAASVEEAAGHAERMGARVTHRLGVIDSVGVEITAAQAAELRRQDGVRLYADLPAIGLAGNGNGGGAANAGRGANTLYPTLVEADKLHRNPAHPLTGAGVTIAVLDTGVHPSGRQIEDSVYRNIAGEARILMQYDAIENIWRHGAMSTDGSGHGTHVTSVAVGSFGYRRGNGRNSPTFYNGIAPDADVVIVKAFDASGVGSYLDVIRGIDWVVTYAGYYGIRVLNLSFSAPPKSHYWDDPLNQAVMRAWQAGIVVVASAGNRGPDAMTIGVPGNVPYVITVGAMSDAATLGNDDDFLASFSSTGPTVEGFVKPEVVAPGGHMLGMMDDDSLIAVEHPEFHDGAAYFMMSGTSQAAAVVSGIVALALEADPALTPDEVKCRLLDGAMPAVTTDPQNGEERLAYSIFQQGAGMANAKQTVESLASGCANRGLDVHLDLAGLQHYGGLANRDENGDYFLMGLEGDGYTWSDEYTWSGGYLWSDGYLWGDGYTWSDAHLWSGGYTWADGYTWSDSFVDPTSLLTEAMAINAWVPQE